MSKVDDAATADGSSGWFKVFQDGWAKNPSGASGDDDFWGTKDLNECCGRMDVKIPDDLPSGDYLLRAEAIALHTAASPGGAQLYMTCYQLTVEGSGNANPPTVNFPGAYSANDPGLLVNIHAPMSDYVVPGPAVYSGGTEKAAGSPCTGCEATCSPGSGPSTTLPQPTSPPGGGGGDNGGNDGGCTAERYQQCGGTGYTGCTNCVVSTRAIEGLSQRTFVDIDVGWHHLQCRLASLLLAVRLSRCSHGGFEGSNDKPSDSEPRRIGVVDHGLAGAGNSVYIVNDSQCAYHQFVMTLGRVLIVMSVYTISVLLLPKHS